VYIYIQFCISCVLLFMVLHFMHGSLFWFVLLLASVFDHSFETLSFRDIKGENV
jgi:hypothetical protein